MIPLLLPLLAPAQAFPDCPYGVNAHNASDDQLALAADAGIHWVRLDVNWYQVEASEGSYDWSTLDRFVDTADDLGLEVFATVAYSPEWAVSGPCDDSAADDADWCHNRLPDEGAWTNFLSVLVARYGGRVKHWGLWNEPNLGGFFSGKIGRAHV